MHAFTQLAPTFHSLMSRILFHTAKNSSFKVFSRIILFFQTKLKSKLGSGAHAFTQFAPAFEEVSIVSNGEYVANSEKLYGKKGGGDVNMSRSLVNLSVFAVIFERCLLVHSENPTASQPMT